jgi:hypothetical protein
MRPHFVNVRQGKFYTFLSFNLKHGQRVLHTKSHVSTRCLSISDYLFEIIDFNVHF